MVDREKWERDRQHEEHLQKVAKQSLCAFPVAGGLCQKPLSVAWIGGQHHLRCGAGHIDPPTDRVKSFTELWLSGEPIPIEIAEKIRKKWRKQMEERGLTTAQIDVLEEVRRTPVTSLSERQTLTLAQVLWPDAPEEAHRRAALLCQQYGLNPLLKQIALVEFKLKGGVSKWEPILAIEATRIIAQHAMHNTRPNYLDDTPRIMTDEEQRLHNGEVDEVNWWALTKVADHAGSTAIGVGSWFKKPYKDENGYMQGEVYGANKGNTAQNMAKIRSERQALKRLCPAELPMEIQVIDAEFIELTVPQVAPKPRQNALPPRQEPRPAGIPTNLVMKTPMDLFGASKRYFNLEQKQVLADLNLTTVQELADVGEAWTTIVALHTGPPEG